MSEMNAQTGERKASSLGQEIVGRINALAAISESPGNLTRLFLTPEHRAAGDLIMSWMVEAGMSARLDAIGNVCGRYEGEQPRSRSIRLKRAMSSAPIRRTRCPPNTSFAWTIVER